MKENEQHAPVVVVGGTCQDFFGEYMSGGIAVLLGLNLDETAMHTGNFMGTGMHGGRIFVRGTVDPTHLGKEVVLTELSGGDWCDLRPLLEEFSGLFKVPITAIINKQFKKLIPKNNRPYGNLYAY
jgi:glutamate synthase domain-containing protein 3